MRILALTFCLAALSACADNIPTDNVDEIVTDSNLLFDYPAVPDPDRINVVIEIPAGTQQKWEAKKSGKGLKWDRKNGKLRVIQYLPYPGNYGMVPRTLLPKSAGGDGDPLDVIVLGSASPRASVVSAIPVGILKLTDGGEQDDKIIAVPETGPLSDVRNLQELDARYPGVTEIIEIWFTSYKGAGKMASSGFADQDAAWQIVRTASSAFEQTHSQ